MQDFSTDIVADVVIVGGGGCGLAAALAACDAGASALILERDASPRGTTAMSTGLIPAAGTPEQSDVGIVDTADQFAADIMAKHGGQTDPATVNALTAASAEMIRWLQSHRIPLSLVTGFLYPGHSVPRMMGTPNRTGEELMASLSAAASRAGADILPRACVTRLEALPSGRIETVSIARPDGTLERIAARTVILACGGFAGNPALIADYIPEMAGATVHSHPGNKGDWLQWAAQLGAATADIGSYQGHAGLAAGHAIPILWPTITEGGIQLNSLGVRFADESRGYSEQAAQVNAQPGKVAWSVWDARIHAVMVQFDDYAQALSAGAVAIAPDIGSLAARMGLPASQLEQTLAEVAQITAQQAPCPFGRVFAPRRPLAPPYYAARVTGALFHTQGGLVVDASARVLRPDGSPLPNLYAGGGAARGISGPGAAGYIAGNGLLTAIGLGRIAGFMAAAQALAQE